MHTGNGGCSGTVVCSGTVGGKMGYAYGAGMLSDSGKQNGL